MIRVVLRVVSCREKLRASHPVLSASFSVNVKPSGGGGVLPRWLKQERISLQCRRCKRLGFSPWVRKIPWRKAWQPTPVFLPGESHGQKSLAGYSPWGCKESDTIELLSLNTLREWEGREVKRVRKVAWVGMRKELESM